MSVSKVSSAVRCQITAVIVPVASVSTETLPKSLGIGRTAVKLAGISTRTL
jgi:hypothetical protein